MSDYGSGIEFTEATRTILGVFAGAIVSFLLVFVYVVYRVTNEIIIARRCILWARISVLAIVICHGIMLHYETTSNRIVLPSLGIVRPIVGLVIMFLAFFVSSHQIFRWMSVIIQPLFVASDVFTASMLQVEIDCRNAGTCLKQSGYTLNELILIERTNFAAAFFQIWLTMTAAYLLICMGAFHNRYPVRLFSITKPLSQLPEARPEFTPVDQIEMRGNEHENPLDDIVDERDATGQLMAQHYVSGPARFR